MSQIIYKIINLINGKFYVGSTTNQKVRFRQHRKLLRGNRHHCKHLQAAWNKYGEDKFSFAVVEEIPSSEALWEAEDRWLNLHVGTDGCYNSGRAAVAPWRGVYGAAHPNFGKAITPEQKTAISHTLKAFYAEDYANHPRVGVPHTAETKAKISAAKLANPTKPWLGQERSDETKQKIGDTQRGKAKASGRTVSEAGRDKIKANIAAGRSHMHWVGKTHTEEAKAKMSKRIIEVTNNIEFSSLSAALQHYGLKMPTLRRALLTEQPLSKGPHAGLQFKYLAPTPAS
jgi:group I intron endonuclease